MADKASATQTAPRLALEAVAAVERILANGGRAEIMCEGKDGEKFLIVKEVKRKTEHKSALT